MTGLRFCAAFLVLIYHSHDNFDWHFPAVNLFFRRGYVAVPLFFCLSGFVLSYTYMERGQLRGTKIKFWFARFARIYPSYFVAFVLFAPVAWVKVPHFLAQAISTVTLTQAWMGFFDWNTPGWSLSVEAFLYLIFPFAMPLVYRIPTRWLIPACLAGWMPALFLPLALPPQLREFSPICHVYSFALGVAAFRLHSEWRWREGSREALAGISAVLLVALLALAEMPEVGLLTSLLAPLMGALIAGLSGTNWLSHPWLVSLGEASYSLYILQSPIHVYVKVAASLLLYHQVANDSLNRSPAFGLVYIILSVLLSLAAFRWIEDPCRHWLINRFSHWFVAPAEVAKYEVPS